MITQDPQTWHEARWPYPRPDTIRKQCTSADSNMRCYLAIAEEDMRHLGLSTRQTWHWCVLPPHRATPLEVGDRVRIDGVKHSVRDVLVDSLPRRKVQIVLLSKFN